MSLFKNRAVMALLVLALAALACAPLEGLDLPGPNDQTESSAPAEAPGPTDTPSATEVPAPPRPEVEGGPVQVRGTATVSNQQILEVYFNQKVVYLQDLTGFANRDFDYNQPEEGQFFGPVTQLESGSEDEDVTLEFLLNLPAAPPTPRTDFDGDGDSGVAVWQVVMDANLIDDPFFGEQETGGWSTTYTSAVIDRENDNEISGGVILVWAQDTGEEFPSGFGEDGLLFTDDDPYTGIEPGYSVVNLDADPFAITQPDIAEVMLNEGDIAVKDLADLSWTEAFDTMFEQVAREYPFTEVKGIDWDAIYAGIAPRIQQAENRGDGEAYYLALRDFTWAIPDGHVGLGGGDTFGVPRAQLLGSTGFTLIELSDGRFLVNYINPASPAAQNGLQVGAEITRWDGGSVAAAVEAVQPYSAPFSNPEDERIQQVNFLVRMPINTRLGIEYQNPGASSPETMTITTYDDGFDTYFEFYGVNDADESVLPVEFDVLDNDYGYIRITTLSDDLFLTMRLWERAIQTAVDLGLPGLIIDMRENGGGSPIGTWLASYFYNGPGIEVTESFYYSEQSGEFESVYEPDTLEPDGDLYYPGPLAILVSTDCASACEDVSYSLGLLEQATVIGYTSTMGIFGEVARGQYELPPGTTGGDPYTLQFPTGYTADMDGSIIIEGPGVVPDERVPVTEEAVRVDSIEGGDYLLDQAVALLDSGAGLQVPADLPAIDGDTSLIDAWSGDTDLLENQARENHGQGELVEVGAELTYSVTFEESTEAILSYIWCAVDMDTLGDGVEATSLRVTINGQDVTSRVGEFTGQLEQPCYFAYLVLDDWPVGVNIIEIDVTFTGAISDGTLTYPAGERRIVYRVTVTG